MSAGRSVLGAPSSSAGCCFTALWLDECWVLTTGRLAWWVCRRGLPGPGSPPCVHGLLVLDPVAASLPRVPQQWRAGAGLGAESPIAVDESEEQQQQQSQRAARHEADEQGTRGAVVSPPAQERRHAQRRLLAPRRAEGAVGARERRLFGTRAVVVFRTQQASLLSLLGLVVATGARSAVHGALPLLLPCRAGLAPLGTVPCRLPPARTQLTLRAALATAVESRLARQAHRPAGLRAVRPRCAGETRG